MPKAIKSQAVIDIVTMFSVETMKEVEEELPSRAPETVMNATSFDSEKRTWILFFDGSAARGKGGTVIVLTSSEKYTFIWSLQLNFPCTSNMAEYEAFLFGIRTSYDMGAKSLRVIGDSNLVIKQVRGEFSVKELALAPYRTAAQEMIKKFQTFSIEYISSGSNRYADALAILGSLIRFTGGSTNISVIKKDEFDLECIEEDEEPENWRSSIKKSFTTYYRGVYGPVELAGPTQPTPTQPEKLGPTKKKISVSIYVNPNIMG